MAKTQTDSTALALQDSDSVSLDRFDEALLTGIVESSVIQDPQELARQIVAQLLAAGSDEELEQFGNAVAWNELLNVPVEIKNFKWLESTFEGEGPPVYVVVQATRLDTGDPVTLTNGSRNVMAALSNMARRGTLFGAVRVLVEADKATRAGFKPLWLRSVEGAQGPLADA